MKTEVRQARDMRELPHEFGSSDLAQVNRVGRYQVIKDAPVLMGSSGHVLFATTPSKNNVALKIGHSSADEAMWFYAREVSMLEKAVRVTSVPEVDDVGSIPLMVSVGANGSKRIEERMFPFFAMEYIPGDTLKEIALNPSPTFAHEMHLLHTLAEAGDALSNAGIVHQDIKPSSAIAFEGITLIDFDTARNVGSIDPLPIRTPGYAALEQLACWPLTGKVTTLQVGASAFNVLTGNILLPDQEETVGVYAQPDSYRYYLLRQVSGLSIAMQDAFLHAAAWKPEDRPTAVEFMSELDAAYQKQATMIYYNGSGIMPFRASVGLQEDTVIYPQLS